MMARVRSHHHRSLHATKTSTTCEGEKEGERRGHRRQGEMLEEEGIRQREGPRGRGSTGPRCWTRGRRRVPSRRSLDEGDGGSSTEE